MQRQDFTELFRIMEGLPVTIRLLDPPLHEFLPHSEAELAEVAEAAGVSMRVARDRHQVKREQPHAGASWLPSGYYLPRDLRHAGKSDF